MCTVQSTDSHEPAFSALSISSSSFLQLTTFTQSANSLVAILRIINRGITGCDSDIGIIGIPAVRPCGTGLCHLYTCLIAESDDLLGTAGNGLETDEISSLGFCPCANLKTGEILVENLLNCLEFRTEDLGVFMHMQDHSIDITEETHMSELVHLIVSDGLDLQLLLDILEIVGRSRQRGIPLPGKVIFEVEANLYTISGCPHLLHSARISIT